MSWRKRRAIELLHRVGIKDHKDAMRSFSYRLTDGGVRKSRSLSRWRISRDS
ncbi:hypothetical protein KCP77_13890 [Salmonella enterica subsp. enterica]|nr:hypothetical protein KCP77_13890 [Salmonella enterica subsp. enterica]